MTTTAKIVAHSRPDWADNAEHDIITMELHYPRMIHAEFMTHRQFSRNASSSRAIPAGRLMQMTTEDPVMPDFWGKNKPGMQATEEFEGQELIEVQKVWLQALKDSALHTATLMNYGLHKQLANRILEPWGHITVVVTATEWENFFRLRAHDAAQPEIQKLAYAMRDAQLNSTPQILSPKQWHLPYALEGTYGSNALRTSVAGCARVSYKNHDGSEREVRKDCKLHDRLLDMKHMSPFEHQARPMTQHTVMIRRSPANLKGITHVDAQYRFWSGNFRHWVQYRQTL